MPARHEKKLLIALVILCSFFILYRFWAEGFADLSSTEPSKISFALKAAPGNAALFYRLGRIEHYYHAKPDLKKAIGFYTGSLGLNPFNPEGHYDLGLALAAAGDRESAIRAMGNAYLLNPMDARHIWNIAVFFLTTTGDMDYAAPYFKKYLELDPRTQSRAFDLFLLMKVPSDYVASKVLGPNERLHSKYLDYLIGHGRAEEALALWAQGYPSAKDERISLRLCELLIGNRKYGEAISVWEKIESDPSRGPLSNPGFEKNSKRACFDWLIEEVKGVSVSRDMRLSTEGAHSLLISFEGENAGVRVRQVVLLKPGAEYALKADIRTDGITTTDGLYALVSGRDCEDLRQSSRVFTGTNPWTPVEIRFRMPAGCRAAEVEFRRDVSSKFNNRIEGRAWLDGVSLKEIRN